jgi:hypothetical protein
MPKADDISNATESPEVTAVSVDSAWLKHCAPPNQKFMGGQVNIVAGRATRADGTKRECPSHQFWQRADSYLEFRA